jgi:hypothetical protein
MRLVYEDTGTPVEIGDELMLEDEEYTEFDLVAHQEKGNNNLEIRKQKYEAIDAW